MKGTSLGRSEAAERRLRSQVAGGSAWFATALR